MPQHWPRITGLARTSQVALQLLPRGFAEEESTLHKKERGSGKDKNNETDPVTFERSLTLLILD
jgi:hypothetical protein